ncbi:MAG TPA: 2Fe-2S iron-sulfur cluster-binding protein [Thermoanaerobaculales bacterium]|nr:2Fe-2S iron-sulfur cluster-binding protein [Thermoanaerobaculales bacterium]HPA83063.1 2Fe-2S iron-sulfur cluster-binding protein [Thermoanaerobaculales bacterium]HQL28988.1 2Fe-2S iron-sulfur cluster-binding protein [Thermoanaerobaculales bacterium]HQN96246.1 2Fe-2S iron-sulfur cluster-binding protein [Thermoanaerobaculales bacterium]HQP42297.1 2Fe-2S iron-sulfur cluster-binding protein [Thermoanaerobaculales bacterium]
MARGQVMDWDDLKVETAIVRCVPSGREVAVVHDTSLVEAVHQASLPLGQSCDGVGVCGFCRVRVLAGAANLTPPAAEESRLLKTLRARPEERLACCARIAGPVTITTDYW